MKQLELRGQAQFSVIYNLLTILTNWPYPCMNL